MYSSIARQCRSEAVVGTQGSCLELFEDRTYRIMEQISAPLHYDRAVAVEELARFPGWAPEGWPDLHPGTIARKPSGRQPISFGCHHLTS